MAWPTPVLGYTRPAAAPPPPVATEAAATADEEDDRPPSPTSSSPAPPSWRSSSALQVWLSPSSSYPRVFLLLVFGSFLFALLFGVATRLSCADGPKMIGMKPRGLYPHLISVLTIVCTTLIPANFIAVFIFHFAKTQPGNAQQEDDDDEPDLTTLTGWWQLAHRIAVTALDTLRLRRCSRRRDEEEEDESHCIAADVWPLSNEEAASPAPFHSFASIDDEPSAAADHATLDKSGWSKPPPPKTVLSVVSLTLSPPLHCLLALLSFSLTASSPIGLWARNGLLDQASNVLTLLHENILKGWGDVSTPSLVFYSEPFTRFLYWLLGKWWPSRLTVICSFLDLTRSFVLLPIWYRHAQWRLQPLPSHPIRVDHLRQQMALEAASDASSQAEEEEEEDEEGDYQQAEDEETEGGLHRGVVRAQAHSGRAFTVLC